MRFILAIVAFVVAAIMIGAGIAQRTIWEPPDHVVAQTTLPAGAPYAVITGKVLNENPNQQAITVSGADHIFVAYGRTEDVMGWIGGQPYAKVSYDQDSNTLSSTLIKANPAKEPASPSPTPSPSPSPSPTPDAAAENDASGTSPAGPGPNPAGSDLWLQQYTGAASMFLRLSLPKDVSVIIANDGAHPAPKNIRISWPVDSKAPWSGPLIVGGGILLLIGLCLYVWALIKLRKSRGPRRKGVKPPKMPKTPHYRPSRQRSVISSSRGRRSSHRRLIAVIPTILVGTLLFTGCSSDYWPKLGSNNASPTPTSPSLLKAAPAAKDSPPAAVTVPQLEQIVTSVSQVAKKADADGDEKLAETRFTGPALELRKTDYAIRAKKKDYPAPPPIPSAPLTLVLPQTATGWPRIVETVVQDKNDAKTPPQLLVLRQDTARENYRVAYAIELEANVRVPDLAPANIGAALVQPDTKLLKIAPDDLVMAYSDILAKGEKSKYYSLFDPDTDKLRSQIGQAYRDKERSDLPKTATINFTDSVGTGLPISMLTNDSGALVAVTLNETETVKPVEKGAQVKPEGAVKALSGIKSTTKGVQSTYSHQLLFYVPPANTQLQVRLLGFTLGLIGASELK